MTTAQRLLFAETMIEDEASLQGQLAELQRRLRERLKAPKSPKCQQCRQAPTEHL